MAVDRKVRYGKNLTDDNLVPKIGGTKNHGDQS